MRQFGPNLRLVQDTSRGVGRKSHQDRGERSTAEPAAGANGSAGPFMIGQVTQVTGLSAASPHEISTENFTPNPRHLPC